MNHRRRSLFAYRTLALSVACVSGSASAEPDLGCEFKGRIVGSLAANAGLDSFASISGDVQARVRVLPKGDAAGNVVVLVEQEGWHLQGMLANLPLTVYLRRPDLLGGLYAPTAMEPLSVSSASKGSAKVAVTLPEEYDSPRIFEQSIPCEQLSMEAAAEEFDRTLAAVGAPVARATLRDGVERVELSATAAGQEHISIDGTAFADDALDVYRRQAGRTRVRMGQLVGWIADELLGAFDEVESLDAGFDEDPNAPIAPWGAALALDTTHRTWTEVPGMYTCDADVQVYAAHGEQFTPVGKVLAGTTFVYGSEHGDFRAVSPLFDEIEAVSLWMEKEDLLDCRRSEPRRLQLEWTDSFGLGPLVAERKTGAAFEHHRDILDLARSYEARAAYELARDAYHAYGQLEGAPRDQAQSALLRAGYLSIVLGELEMARHLLTRGEEALLGDARYTELTARLAQAMLRDGKTEAAASLLGAVGLRTSNDGAGRIALARASGLRARAFEALGRTAEADVEWAACLGTSEVPLVNIHAGASDEQLAHLAELSAEALFHRATRLHAEANRMSMPRYTGPRMEVELARFFSDQIGPWWSAKRERLQAASEAYELVLGVEPEPPPHWVIASAARVGQLWGDFVADFHSLPVPDGWEAESDVRLSYVATFDSPDEPFRQMAKSAYLLALHYGNRFQIANSDTRAAEVWLAANYRVEFRLLDEFVPQATRTGQVRFPAVPLD